MPPPRLASLKTGTLDCRCGCRNAYPLFSGLLAYGTDQSVAYRLAHFEDANQARHLWLLLGSGPWFDDDPRGCWCILDNWIEEDSLIARASDARDSPFFLEHIFDERFLTRDEVLARDGALAWAVDRREDLLQLHVPTREFIMGPTLDA